MYFKTLGKTIYGLEIKTEISVSNQFEIYSKWLKTTLGVGFPRFVKFGIFLLFKCSVAFLETEKIVPDSSETP